MTDIANISSHGSNSWLCRSSNFRQRSDGLLQRRNQAELFIGLLRKSFTKSSSGRLIFQCRLCGEVSPLYGVSRKRNCSNKILTPFVTAASVKRCRLFCVLRGVSRLFFRILCFRTSFLPGKVQISFMLIKLNAKLLPAVLFAQNMCSRFYLYSMP